MQKNKNQPCRQYANWSTNRIIAKNSVAEDYRNVDILKYSIPLTETLLFSGNYELFLGKSTTKQQRSDYKRLKEVDHSDKLESLPVRVCSVVLVVLFHAQTVDAVLQHRSTFSLPWKKG
jgi:hypothetical protein